MSIEPCMPVINFTWRTYHNNICIQFAHSCTVYVGLTQACPNYICLCVCAYEREVTRSHLTWAKNLITFLGIAGLGALQQIAHWHSWLWPQQQLKWAASKAWRSRTRLKCTLTYGGLKNAKGWHSRVMLPIEVLSRRRRFSSKHILLGALAIEAARQLTNFSS